MSRKQIAAMQLQKAQSLDNIDADSVNGASATSTPMSKKKAEVLRMKSVDSGAGAAGQGAETNGTGGANLSASPIAHAESSQTLASMHQPVLHSLGLGLSERRRTARNVISPDIATASLIKGLMGTGMLSLPIAFRNAGLYAGLALAVGLCTLNAYCMRLLVHAAHHFCAKCGKAAVDYANVASFAVKFGPPPVQRFGKAAKIFVNALIFINQFGFCCCYFVFMADNMQQVTEHWFPDSFMNQGLWITAFLIPELLLACVRSLRALGPVTLAANVLYFSGLLVIFAYLMYNHKPSDRLPYIAGMDTLPLAFGTIMFAFEGVALVLPIENRCRYPSHFAACFGGLNSACAITICAYMLIGFFGYIKAGADVHDTITLDLPVDEWYYALVKVGVTLAIMFTFALQFYVPIERIEMFIKKTYFKNDKVKRNALYYGVRMFAVLVTYALAMAIPHLNLFMSLVGSFGGTFLALICPTCITLLVNYDKGTLNVCNVAGSILVIIIGVAGFAIGTFSSLKEIISVLGKPVDVK